jgi:translation initiation factor 3 subunit L
MVHVEETTSHRRFAGFFIRNAEHAQRVLNTIRAAPLPVKSVKTQNAPKVQGEKPNWAGKKQVRITA